MAKKAKTPPVEYTLEQKRQLLLTPCKNKKEVQAWIQYFLGLHLPDHTVSRHATTNPLDVVYEMYRICVLKQNPENIQELLYTAARGAGKTLATAIAEFMILLHDQRDIAHVGAIMAQAKRAYEYVQGFCMAPNVKPIVDPATGLSADKILQKSTMEKSIFKVNNILCTMEILPTTMKALNGLHVSLVSCDELDTLNGESLRAIKEVAGMLDTKKGKKPLKVGISTRKSKYGLMNKMIENADKEGRHLRFWTALEFTECCPPLRSGRIPTPYWLNVEKGDILTESEFEKKGPQHKKEYIHEPTGMFNECRSCPVAVFCRGDAKKQVSKSNMLKSIDELNQKIRSEGFDWAASQLFNLKPSTEGIIFREFDEKLHVKDWDQMWLVLTGKSYPGECTHDMFVKKCHEMCLPCYAGIDWGFSAPNTVVYFFMDKRDNVYIVRCDGMTYVSEPTWIHHLKTKYHNIYRCQLYIPDAANQGAILEMGKAGLPVANQMDKGAINTGVQIIKKLLKVPGATEPKIFFARETCMHLINEMGMYHYKLDAAGIVTDDPDTEYDHWVDALRYALTLFLGKANIMLGGGLELEESPDLTDRLGNFRRTPNASEYADAQGLPLGDTDQDVSKLGKIGTKSDLDSDDDDEGTSGGGGGFLWNV